MTELVFLLEEPSARAMLEGLIPRLEVSFSKTTYMVFEGKNDLERRMRQRIQGYLNPEAKFIIIRDQDSHPNCKILKAKLHDICVQAGRPDAFVRIFCKELETIYLADLKAVESGLNVSGIAKR
ncbi:hypothetical protein P7D22_18225 [Lichenihabitans sp. Uapishka_5]|uniref:hypothetical protein n=1 Tax=Lichenihabitans sp. Uapishka_5 TaxID=3037302 RepID=UPI0029E81617|nr:hypothetical protein [Lichenihabitans sp. Uapishka_5]MDX7953103.1 hypothetical protein [Lichenihabitans sp. Uapishka_5]